MKTFPRRCSPYQAMTASDSYLIVMTDSTGTQNQLKDEMSVDLVNAQVAQAWQVQQK